MRHGKAVGHVGEQADVTARTAHRKRRGRHAFAQLSAAKSGVAPRIAHRGGALWKPGPLAGADCRTAHKALVRRHVAAWFKAATWRFCFGRWKPGAADLPRPGFDVRKKPRRGLRRGHASRGYLMPPAFLLFPPRQLPAVLPARPPARCCSSPRTGRASSRCLRPAARPRWQCRSS